MNLAAISAALPISGDLSSIASLSPAPIPAGAAPAGRSEGAPFARMMSDVIQDMQQHHRQMDQDIQGLASGQADNVHQIVMNVAETDLMFQMLIEVRDKLISSYQEIMRMQI